MKQRASLGTDFYRLLWQGFARNLVKACETVDAMEQTGDVGDSFSAMP